MPSLARGAQVRLDLLRWDEVDLSVEARLLEVKSTVPATEMDDLSDEEDEDVELLIPPETTPATET